MKIRSQCGFFEIGGKKGNSRDCRWSLCTLIDGGWDFVMVAGGARTRAGSDNPRNCNAMQEYI